MSFVRTAFLAFLSFFFVFGFDTALAKTIYVPDDYLSISSALRFAEFGDVVRVRSGRYVENVVVPNGVWLVGDSPITTIISGASDDNVVSFLGNEHGGIRNFTVADSGEKKASIYVYDSDVVVENNFITRGGNAGLSLYEVKGSEIVNNMIFNNLENGVWALDAAGSLLAFNTIDSNAVGMHIYRSEGIDLLGNQLTFNERDAIKLSFSDVNYLGYHHYDGNGGIDELSADTDVFGNACITDYYLPCTDSILVDASPFDSCLDRNGSRCDIGAYGSGGIQPFIQNPDFVQGYVGVGLTISPEVFSPLYTDLEFEWDLLDSGFVSYDLQNSFLSFVPRTLGDFEVAVRVSNGVWSNWHTVLVRIDPVDDALAADDLIDGVSDLSDSTSDTDSGNSSGGNSGSDISWDDFVSGDTSSRSSSVDGDNSSSDFYCSSEGDCPSFHTCVGNTENFGVCKKCISDCLDNDGDGLIDEDILNGVDDDGDGCIDEDGFGGGVCFGNGIDDDGDGYIDEDVYDCIDNDEDGLIDEDAVGGTPLDCAGVLSSRPYFDDVPMTHWAENYIDTLYEYDALHGYPDRFYRPGKNISRAEALKVLMRANDVYSEQLVVDEDGDGLSFEFEEMIGSADDDRDTDGDGFEDFDEFTLGFNVLGDGSFPYSIDYLDMDARWWHYDYIRQASQLGIVQGYGNGYFGPFDYISRGEFLKMILSLRGIALSDSDFQYFKDVPPSHWVQKYVATGIEHGFISDGDYFRPWDYILRSEAAKMIYRLGIKVTSVDARLCSELTIYPSLGLCDCPDGASMETVYEQFQVCPTEGGECSLEVFERFQCR